MSCFVRKLFRKQCLPANGGHFLATTVYSENILAKNGFKQMVAAFLGQMFPSCPEKCSHKTFLRKQCLWANSFLEEPVVSHPGANFPLSFLPRLSISVILLFPQYQEKTILLPGIWGWFKTIFRNKKCVMVFPFAEHVSVCLTDWLTHLNLTTKGNFALSLCFLCVQKMHVALRMACILQNPLYVTSQRRYKIGNLNNSHMDKSYTQH